MIRDDPQQSSMLPAIGQVFDGSYEILERLDRGRGGIGAVFRARDVLLGEECALKVLQAPYARDEQWIQRLCREGKVMYKLRHENIARVSSMRRAAEGPFYIVMEYLDGCALDDVLKSEGALSWPRALEISQQLAAALEAAHAIGVVHRDIKPSNIILVRDEGGRERVKVLDFGIAKARDTKTDVRELLKTATGAFLGTPGYIAPECVQDAPHDHRVDVYALGVVLYEMLTGRRPENLVQVKPPSRLGPPEEPIPTALDPIVQRALEIDPDRRYPTVRDLLRDLDAVAPLVAQGLPPVVQGGAAVRTRPLTEPYTALPTGRLRPSRTVSRRHEAARASSSSGAMLATKSMQGQVAGVESDEAPAASASTKLPGREREPTERVLHPPSASPRNAAVLLGCLALIGALTLWSLGEPKSVVEVKPAAPTPTEVRAEPVDEPSPPEPAPATSARAEVAQEGAPEEPSPKTEVAVKSEKPTRAGASNRKTRGDAPASLAKPGPSAPVMSQQLRALDRQIQRECFADVKTAIQVDVVVQISPEGKIETKVARLPLQCVKCIQSRIEALRASPSSAGEVYEVKYVRGGEPSVRRAT